VRQIFLIAWVVLSFPAASGAVEDLLTMELSARTGSLQQTAGGQASTSSAGDLVRPVLAAKPTARLRIRWSVANQEKAGNISDVTVHFFLDRENAIGDRVPPKPGADVVYESALVVDLAAHATTSADFVVEAPGPGNYLLRLETIGATRVHGHEHVAAMDLKVAR
jgi:hypothetical protein